MKKKILLLGTHGQYNWGDDLLLETFLTQLGSSNEYYVNSYDPYVTEKSFKGKFSIKTFHTTKEKFNLLKYIFKADLIFFAGGTILRELYLTSGRNRYSSLLMVCMLVVFGKKIAQKKIIMSNIGVGPIKTKIGRYIARLALNNTDFVSLRDQQSYDLVKDLKTKNLDFIVVPDAIFVRKQQDFISDENNNQATNFSSEKKVLKIGLNLNFDIANPSNWNHFITNLKYVLVTLSKQYNLLVYTIPMQVAFNPRNDLVTMREFKETLKEIKFIEIIPSAPKDIGSAILACDIILGERFHTIVISTIIGIPFVALEYDIKVNSLVKRLGLEDYGIDINLEFDKDKLLDLVQRVIEDKKIIEAKEQMKAEEYNTELVRYFKRLNEKIQDEVKH